MGLEKLALKVKKTSSAECHASGEPETLAHNASVCLIGIFHNADQVNLWNGSNSLRTRGAAGLRGKIGPIGTYLLQDSENRRITTKLGNPYEHFRGNCHAEDTHYVGALSSPLR